MREEEADHPSRLPAAIVPRPRPPSSPLRPPPVSAKLPAMRDRTGDRTSDSPPVRTVLSVPEAAERLDLTPDAIRARLHRGTLPGEKRGRQWVVFLSPTADRQDAPPDTQQDTDRIATGTSDGWAELMAALRSEVDHLREESRRKDHIIAGLVQRLPELPAGEGTPTRPPDAPGATQRTAPAPDTAASWWQRWFRRMTEGR